MQEKRSVVVLAPAVELAANIFSQMVINSVHRIGP